MKTIEEDELIRQHHQLSGHEFEQTPGDNKGQGSLACFSPWGHKESDTTEQLNNKSAYNSEIHTEIFMDEMIYYLGLASTYLEGEKVGKDVSEHI